VKQQRKLIDDAEGGTYTEGMYSHFVPASHKPQMPVKEHYPRLYEALSKEKMKASIAILEPAKDPL